MRRLSGVTHFEARGGVASYVEHLRERSMSAGTYSIPAGAADPQSPHAEDELYFVLDGSARFTAGDETVNVNRGDALFVSAGEAHHFHDVTQDLALLVVFAPPESRLER